MEARQVWSETLENAPADAEGRAGVADRLARLDAMLGAMQAGEVPLPTEDQPAAPEPAGE